MLVVTFPISSIITNWCHFQIRFVIKNNRRERNKSYLLQSFERAFDLKSGNSGSSLTSICGRSIRLSVITAFIKAYGCAMKGA